MKTIQFIISLAFVTSFVACTKESEEDIDTSQSAFETEVGILSEEVEKSADAVTFEENLLSNQLGQANGPIPDCASISIEFPEGGDFPRVITIDYGEENCQVRPNLTKRGKVIVTLTDSISAVNSQRIISFDSFYINDNLVTGERILTNIGLNEDGYFVFDIDNDFSIGDWSRVTDGSKTFIEGFETPGYEDNVFLIDGSSETTRSTGLVINRTITESLRVDRSCGYITEGTVSITWNEEMASIDFGDGSCDNIAIITRNDQEFEIEMTFFRCHRRFN